MEEWWKWAAANSNSMRNALGMNGTIRSCSRIPPLTQEEHATCIVRLFFEPLMDTNGQKPGVTTKNTKHTKTRGVGMF